MLEPLVEAGEEGGGVCGSTAREGALMIHLPQYKQGHTRLALLYLGGGKVWMTTNPVCQTGIHRLQIHRQVGAGNGRFSRFHARSPSSDIHLSTRTTIPAGE